MYHLCLGRDHQSDGGLSLGLHGASWLHFCRLIPNWQILYYRPTFLTSLEAFLDHSGHKSSAEAAGLGSSEPVSRAQAVGPWQD